MDRTEVSRCVAKIISYLNVGKRDDAQYWWDKLKNLAAKEGLK
jgi:hypothetical protein